jgi:hypothetical protein
LKATLAQLEKHLTIDHKFKGLNLAITVERIWYTLGNGVSHLVECFTIYHRIKGSDPDTCHHQDKVAERVCFARNIGTVGKPFN